MKQVVIFASLFLLSFTINSPTLPHDAVIFITDESCPLGFIRDSKYDGKYLVGVPDGGTRNGTKGTALNKDENRIIGRHLHLVTGLNHSHELVGGTTETSGALFDVDNDFDLFSSFTAFEGDIFTGITIDNEGTVTGTNSPYLTLLLCRKL